MYTIKVKKKKCYKTQDDDIIIDSWWPFVGTYKFAKQIGNGRSGQGSWYYDAYSVNLRGDSYNYDSIKKTEEAIDSVGNAEIKSKVLHPVIPSECKSCFAEAYKKRKQEGVFCARPSDDSFSCKMPCKDKSDNPKGCCVERGQEPGEGQKCCYGGVYKGKCRDSVKSTEKICGTDYALYDFEECENPILTPERNNVDLLLGKPKYTWEAIAEFYENEKAKGDAKMKAAFAKAGLSGPEEWNTATVEKQRMVRREFGGHFYGMRAMNIGNNVGESYTIEDLTSDVRGSATRGIYRVHSEVY